MRVTSSKNDGGTSGRTRRRWLPVPRLSTRREYHHATGKLTTRGFAASPCLRSRAMRVSVSAPSMVQFPSLSRSRPLTWEMCEFMPWATMSRRSNSALRRK